MVKQIAQKRLLVLLLFQIFAYVVVQRSNHGGGPDLSIYERKRRDPP